VTGGRPPPRGGFPRPRYHGPRRRPWSWYPRRAQKYPSLGHRWRHQQASRRCQRARRRYPPALEEEEAGFLQLEVSSISPRTPLISRGCRLLSYFLVDRVTPIVLALAPAKALRSGAPMTTGQRSARVPRIAAGAAATGEPSRVTAAVMRPQQEEVVAASVMVTGESSRVTAAVSGQQQEEAVVATSQALVLRAPSQGRGQAHPESQPAGDHEAVGAAADDNAPPDKANGGGNPGQPPSARQRCR
jgi:hypothetical protein